MFFFSQSYLDVLFFNCLDVFSRSYLEVLFSKRERFSGQVDKTTY